MKVMIVDDAVFMRISIKNMLEDYDYEIIEAENGKIAIEKYKEFKPDIVTLDITMPVMTGIDALKEIIKIDNEAKVIMVSSLGQENKVMDAMSSGAKDFVLKPLKEDKVKAAIERVLKKSIS